MTVEVHDHFHLAFLVELPDHLPQILDFGVQQVVGILPGAVEVLAGQTAALVPINDAIGVDHGHDFEDEAVAEQLGLLGSGHDEVDEAAHHPGAVGLARVAPARHHDAALLLLRLLVALAGHRQLPQVVAAQGFAQFAFEHELFALLVLQDALDVRVQLRVSLWLAVTELHLIIVVLELLSETECVVGLT